MADPNTRQGKRTPVTLKIKFKSETLEQFIERYAVDVSQGGIFIRTKEPLAVGTQMRFEFQLRDASPLIAGEGTVVWTRENDPSRPAIAPGMGVRFDRLAEGSQTVLERILSEKAKQAPHRGDGPTKPPLFTDTPTRVAPAPVQDALLGNESRRNTRDFPPDKTPLPKAQPFHSDADEFPDEAFEEATKVRALDDLIAQTADDASGSGGDLFTGKPPDELAARRAGLRNDSTLSDPAAAAKAAASSAFEEPSGTSPGFASARSSQPAMPGDGRDSAPGLPSPPETGKQPRLLDTSPSPRTTGGEDAAAAAKAALIAQNDRMEKLAKTKIGMEPAQNLVGRSQSTSTPPVSLPVVTPPMPVVARDAPTRPSGIPVSEARAAMEAPKRSKAPLIILLLVLLAGGGAAVWFFVLREKAVENNGTTVASGSGKTGSAEKPPDGSGSDKVAVGSGTGSAKPEPPKGPMIDIELAAPFPKATIEVVDTDIKGPAPLKTKLEKDKVYKVRAMAPGYATSETDVKGGTDKWVAKLDPKPYVVTVSSEPAGALIMVDGQPIGHSTPFDVELTKVQVARKNVRFSLRKSGYKPIDKMLDTSAFTEDPAKMMSQISEKLSVQQVVVVPKPPVGSGSGSAGSGEPTGSATPPTGGSDTTPPAGSGTPTPPTGGNGGGSAKEPEPEFVKPTQP